MYITYFISNNKARIMTTPLVDSKEQPIGETTSPPEGISVMLSFGGEVVLPMGVL